MSVSGKAEPVPEDEREYCCNRYALWALVVNVVKPGTMEMHCGDCMPDAYVSRFGSAES